MHRPALLGENGNGCSSNLFLAQSLSVFVGLAGEPGPKDSDILYGSESRFSDTGDDGRQW